MSGNADVRDAAIKMLAVDLAMSLTDPYAVIRFDLAAEHGIAHRKLREALGLSTDAEISEAQTVIQSVLAGRALS